jgi:nitroreductase
MGVRYPRRLPGKPSVGGVGCSFVDAYLAVVSKREVRSYAERPLGDEAERRILEAGRVAGSSKNRQARRFVVLRDPALLDEAAQSVYAPDNVRGAAFVVAIVTGGKGPTSFDAGRAAQNMMLAASNDGIGSCPNGIADAAQLQSAVGHGDDEQVATVLTFGYPERPRDPERRSAEEWIARADRLPYEEVVEER